ncbi:hypothetical protein A2U01_0058558 [Trifolium medium]|uniref:Uncharacterized protein n=1 Tax=Trifolium medium TaxID=97028 RepID=A0A392RMN2_9FABA|nr:hypothetical protein [Trifolium medium]
MLRNELETPERKSPAILTSEQVVHSLTNIGDLMMDRNRDLATRPITHPMDTARGRMSMTSDTSLIANTLL